MRCGRGAVFHPSKFESDLFYQTFHKISTLFSGNLMFYKKFRSFLPSIEDLHGPEVDIIRRNQLEFDPVPVSLQGQPVALGVEMAVIAAAHAIALQQLQRGG